jgi:Kef-type K+ transport system membrane component KefB
MDLLAVVVGWLLLSMAAGIYAGRRHRSATAWALIALLASPLIAFVFGLVLGAKVTERIDRVPCPFCSEAVLISAVRCPHCRSDL